MFRKKTLFGLFCVVLLIPLLGLIGLNLMSKRPANLGATDGQLSPCPDSPNCVSSQATDDEHGMQPVSLDGDASTAIEKIKKVMGERPRTELVTESDNYLHFEETSKILRFVDDIEFYINEGNKLIHFRSASRIGRSDLGVNRNRMEEIIEALKS